MLKHMDLTNKQKNRVKDRVNTEVLRTRGEGITRVKSSRESPDPVGDFLGLSRLQQSF